MALLIHLPMTSLFNKLIKCSKAAAPITFTQLLKLFNSLTEIVGAIDKTGRFVYCNQASLPIWGYRPEELLEKSFFDSIIAKERTAAQTAIETAARNGAVFHLELRHYRKDSSIATMLWNGRWDTDEQRCYLTGKDISIRRELEAELEMLSLIAKETVNAITVTDEAGKIVWVNQSFTRLTGYSFSEAIGHTPPALLQGPRTDAKVIEQTNARLAKGETFSIEILGYKKDKTPYWSHIHFQPMLDKQGQRYRYIAIETDITEQRRLQQRLTVEIKQRQRKITAAVIQAQEQERAQVGQELHDNVNQVLTTVKLYNELCLSGISNEGELLSKSIALLQASINEIRSLSRRLAAPSLGAIRLRDSVNDLLDTLSATNRLRIFYHTHNLDNLYVEERVHLAIYRILQEHFTNILKHAEAQEAVVRMVYKEPALIIEVVDDGKGFELKKKRKGIGITNMISRAEHAGGVLQLTSAPGKGCTLHLRFSSIAAKPEPE